MTLVIAPATPADLDAIDQIEQRSFPAPWPKATFAAELTRDFARLIVARASGDDARIVGFCNYWLVTTEVHILVIATDPELRGHGIGSALLSHALATPAATLATLEVRRSNTAAIALYSRAGFQTVHTRTRYYQDDGEDALVMLKQLA